MYRSAAGQWHRWSPVAQGLLVLLLLRQAPVHAAGTVDVMDTFLSESDSNCTNPQDFECGPGGAGGGDEAPICISAASVCNGAPDCPNGRDESDCDYNLCRAPLYFRCRGGKCIVSAFRCDGTNDCPQNDDETDCDGFVAHHEVTECTADQFRCAADGLCITRDYECDGQRHCLDGSDEHAECASDAKAKLRCKGGFLCANRHCLSDTRWRCDGENDCGDGSDEVNCTGNCTVEWGRFRCADNRTCLQLQDSVCNGVADCPAGDDEGGSCQEYPGRTCPAERCPAAVKCVVLPSGPRCVCAQGFAYNATSRACEDVDECAEYGRCTQGCLNTVGSYRCTCAERFRLRSDRRTCTVSSRSGGRADAVLVFAGATSVMAIQLGEKLHQFQVSNATDHVVGVSYDGRFVYWTDIATASESIVRAHVDGSAHEVILTAGLAAPEDIAVDWVTGNLYLTDRTYQHIAVCSNDGLHCASLVNGIIEKPRSIVLVPQRGEMYWSDWMERRPMIGRAGMDGRDVVPFVTENLGWPSGVTVDMPNDRLYWVDSKLLRIESIGMDGRGRRVVLDRVLKHPHGIAVFENSIYWSDWKTQSVQRCDKFTCKNRQTVAKDRVIYDIHIYHKALQPKRANPCEAAPCSHLCLLAAGANGTFTCACPVGWMLDADQRKCSPAYKQQLLLVGVGNYLVEMQHRSFGRQVAGESKALGMHIDRLALNTLNGEVFVASNVQHAIYMVNLETLHTKLLVSSNVGEVSALAFDHLGNNLYWTDAERGTIEVLSLRSNHQAIVYHYMGTSHPIALAVMPERAQLMVAVRNDFGHTHFARLAMSGVGDYHQVMDTGIGVDGIQFVTEPEVEQVYWLDGEFQKIMFTDYDFVMNHSFINDLDHPTAMAILEEDVFWTTEHTTRIYWAPKHRPSDIKRLVLSVPPFQWKITNDVMHLLALRPKHTNVEHPCQTHDECSDICVPDTGAMQYACLCPPGMVFKDRSNRTCLEAIECEFRCRSSGECLAQSRACDGRKDCVDGSDENHCSATASRPLVCSLDEFRCTDDTSCVARDLRCDKFDDCPDKSDEADCENYNRTTRCRSGQFQCAEGRCIDANARCDTVRDCTNGEDETDCGEPELPVVLLRNNTVVRRRNRCEARGQFRCGASGQCVPLSFRCDGLADCADGSDEHRCPAHSCSEKYFQCAFGQCIDRRLVCDGHNHCGDNSDEIACGGSATNQADIACGEVDAETKQPTMYQCQSNRTLCLPIRAHCNGTAECPRGEDEAGCGGCQLNQFECANKRCVRVEWRCDGQDDCEDGSDELHCTAPANGASSTQIGPSGAGASCNRAHSFDCGDGTCIDLINVCDGHRDCAAGSDEGGLCAAPCGPDVCQQRCRSMPAGPVCSCNDGYTQSGNRRQCLDVDECREREPCAQQCDNTEGSFYCSCFVDYVLHTDKMSCRAVDRRKYMLFSSFDTIYNVTARTLDLLWSSNGTRIAGMDVNVAAGLLYFTMADSSGLYEYDLGTRRIQYIPNVGAPRRLAVDWSTNNVYFVDESAAPVMRVCHMREKVCALLFHFNYRDIVKALRVDALNGRLFYAVLQFAVSLSPQSVVYSHALDGSRTQVLVKDAAHISALECEPRKRLLYFAELATATVWSVGYDGGVKRRLFGPGEPAITRPMALMLSEDELYVFNVGTTVAGHCKVYGDHKCKTFDIAVYNAENLVVMHAPSQKRVANVCDGHRCAAICVPAQRGPRCLCHGGTMVDEGVACTDGGKTDRRMLYDADQSAGAQTTKSKGGMAGTVFSILGWCVLLAAIGGAVYWMYKRKLFRRKFVASVHFQNPRSTLIAGPEGFGGTHKMGAPQMFQTNRYNEIFLNDLSTDEMCDATAPPPARTDQRVAQQQLVNDDDRLTTQLIGKD